MSSTIIDHAIAIPTKQHNVWDNLSDITNFPRWREDIQSITFLTGKQEGRGTRFRTTSRRGVEQVIEITAWYEGLGYEYVIVDGSPYDNNRGRIRLQESTEGTIVQWTFSYELSGFLSGLRNSLSVRRGLDNDITDNLRSLYTYVKETRGEERFVAEESKAYLQEAPDVLARSTYQPRYPSKSDPNMPAVPEDIAAPDHSIFEPPVAEDDTKPNPSVQTAQEKDFTPLPEVKPLPGIDPMPEPEFLKNVPDLTREAPPLQSTQVQPEPLPHFEEQNIETESITPSAPPTPSLIEEPAASVASPVTPEPAQPEPAAEPTEVPEPTLPSVDTSTGDDTVDEVYTESLAGLPYTDDVDTSKMSVFEIFGLPKPSETENTRTIQSTPPIDLNDEPPLIEANTQQMKAFTDAEPIVPDIEPDDTTRRRGLRASLRRKKTRVRLPK